MLKKRVLSMLVTGAMCVGILAGCGGDSSSSGSGTASGGSDGDIKISFIMKTLSSEHWQFMKAGAEAYAAEHEGVSVDIKGPPSETSYDEQQNQIETDLAVDYDAYCIAPLQSDLVANLIAGQTTPIIAVDTQIDAP